MNSEFSDVEFWRRRIQAAQTIAGLEFVGDQIKEDAQNGEQYTTDKQNMKSLRTEWEQRHRELSVKPVLKRYKPNCIRDGESYARRVRRDQAKAT